jgi:hypothetical protein
MAKRVMLKSEMTAANENQDKTSQIISIVDVLRIIRESGWDGDGMEDPAAAIAGIEMAIECEETADFIGAQKYWYVLLRRWYIWQKLRGAPIDREVIALFKLLQTQIR